MKPFARDQTVNAVDLYMTEIGQFPLLSARKERTLAMAHKRGRAAERQLEAGVTDVKTRARVRDVAERGRRARQRLVHCNLRLVIHLVQPYVRYGLDFGDLVQEGNIGLLEAVDRFDPRRGVRLATYAGWWIRRAVLRALCDQGRAIRLPAAVNDELLRLKRIHLSLEARLGRAPTQEELAAEMGISKQRVRMLQRWDRDTLSLDMSVGEGDEAVLSDILPDPKAPPLEEALVRRQLQERLRAAMDAHLTHRDQMVLSLRFGLGGAQRRTLQEIASKLGITRERARQVEKMALRRLRRSGALYELSQA
jgi:RNA polymerase sigma factor (sigma-70 family)